MITLNPLFNFVKYHPPKDIYHKLTNYDGKQNAKIIRENKGRFDNLSEIFEDNFSKKVLNAILAYRTTQNMEHLYAVGEVDLEQYFDKCLTFSSEEVFIDCGGYIGDTTKNFILRNPKYEKIFIYEPIPSQFEICRRYFYNNPNIILKNKCVGNENTSVKMNMWRAGSYIDKKGDVSANIVRLDDDLQDVHPTFVKMDIEGFELDALKGMTRILKEDKPKLAICVYHKPMDILEIPEFIKSVNPDYKISLRHYLHSLEREWDSVIYAY